MVRWLKPWSKKRGGRRSGSQLMGSVGEAVFFAFLGLLGAITLVLLLVSARFGVWPARAYFPESYYEAATARVLEKRLADLVGMDHDHHYRAELLLEYEFDGQPLSRWVPLAPLSSDRQRHVGLLEKHTVGDTRLCWLNSQYPFHVALQPPSHWAMYLVLLVLVSFTVIGGGGFAYTVLEVGTSAERRAALAKDAANLDLIREASLSPSEYPTVPRDTDLTNSPGVTLTYRLPVASSPAWKVFMAALFCVVWNSIAALFVIIVIRSLMAGRPERFLIVISIPFLVVGFWSIYYLLRQLWVAAGVGPTHIEISDHPVYPKRNYQLLLSQAGRLSIRTLELFLVCEEEATFRQGTDVRTERQQVHRERILEMHGVEIKPGKPMERECQLQLSDDVMHSFRSVNNLVCWNLVLEGNVAGRPTFHRSFPIIVYPFVDGKNRE